MSSNLIAPDEFRVGAYLDAKDTLQHWCAARILELGPTMIHLRFDGWSEKWDVKVPYASARVAPFRLHSVGYTGQKKAAIREWLYTIDEVEQAELQLASLQEGDFKCGTAWDTTQFYRGYLYTLVDCLLTHGYKDERGDTPRVAEFFLRVVEFVVA